MGVKFKTIKEGDRLMVTEDRVRRRTDKTNGMNVTRKWRTFYIKKLCDLYFYEIILCKSHRDRQHVREGWKLNTNFYTEIMKE